MVKRKTVKSKRTKMLVCSCSRIHGDWKPLSEKGRVPEKKDRTFGDGCDCVFLLKSGHHSKKHMKYDIMIAEK